VTPRRETWVLAAASAVVLLAHLPITHATAWHYFDSATHRLASGDALHLYAGHPEYQFGPLSVAVALPFAVLGSGAAMVALSAAGVWTARRLLDVVRLLAPEVDPRSTLIGGLLLVVVWGDIAVRTTHLDDAVALTATVAGLVALTRGRNLAGALAFGVAGAAKPWAIAFAPILLAVDHPRRWRLLAVAAGVVVLTWAPFLLAGPDTLDTADYRITNEDTSALRAFGVDDPVTPDWVRPAQLAGGLAIALLLVARRRWTGVIMATVAVRLLLDPAANRYYTAGLVLGVLLHELTVRPRRWPWLALGSALVLELTATLDAPPTPSSWLRVAVVAVVLVEAVRAPVSPRLGSYAAPPWQSSGTRNGSTSTASSSPPTARRPTTT
jgi:Glycosyltransferase family 87